VICEGHVGYRAILYVTFRFILGEVKGNRSGRREMETAEHAREKKTAEGAEKRKPQRTRRKREPQRAQRKQNSIYHEGIQETLRIKYSGNPYLSPG
jgi:hypothetical protein